MEELRPLLLVYAYNIIGTYDEAKDIVQDTYLKFAAVDQSSINDKKAYLVRMTINLAIDQKRKQKKLQRVYQGQWLPEPVSTDNVEHSLFKEEVLSYSVMVMLERLSSKQRAVFILKEAFDYDHDEIAEVLGITSENSRKILSRAKKDIQIQSAVPSKVKTPLLTQYLSALQHGDVKALEKMLHDEITAISDGGGKVSAFVNPIRGVKDVTALLMGLNKKAYKDMVVKQGVVNHEPALFYYVEGQLTTCMVFSVVDDRMQSIYFIRNPDKLDSLKNLDV